MTTIAITMAGRGQRFRDAGWQRPKYEIEVGGRTLFRWSLESLQAWFPETTELLLVARREDDAGPFTQRQSEAIGLPTPRLIELEATTDGQATTALLAAEAASDPSRPLLIYNIDTHVLPGAMAPGQARGDGFVPCFQASGDHWSFAAIGDDGWATELAEKRRISPHATLGLYWFASAALYLDIYRAHFANGGTEAGERYIAPMYNTLIAQGGKVSVSDVPSEAVIPLGTPAEVEAFAASIAP